MQNRHKEQCDFLTEHFESEVKRIFGEYLRKMHSVDRVHAALKTTSFLSVLTAHTLGMFARNDRLWRILIQNHFEDVLSWEEDIDFDGVTYFDNLSGGENE